MPTSEEILTRAAAAAHDAMAALGGRGGRAWTATLAAAALLYGAIGVFQLGVAIDLGLLVGAVALLALPGSLRASPSARRLAPRDRAIARHTG
jgi:hypothetical protein